MLPNKEGVWELFTADGERTLACVYDVGKKAGFEWLRSYWKGGYYNLEEGNGKWGEFVGEFSKFTNDELDSFGGYLIYNMNFSRIKDEELWSNGFNDITPAHLLDTIQTAKDKIDYSNYDCANLNRLQEILLRYCEEHNIKVDLKEAERIYKFWKV